MQQQDFNLTHAVSHKSDPDTSKAAERSITQSGARKSNNQRVAWLVARYPGKTASELSEIAREKFEEFAAIFGNQGSGAVMIEVRRRLSDMNGIHVQRGTKDEARMGLLRNKESIWRPK